MGAVASLPQDQTETVDWSAWHANGWYGHGKAGKIIPWGAFPDSMVKEESGGSPRARRRAEPPGKQREACHREKRSGQYSNRRMNGQMGGWVDRWMNGQMALHQNQKPKSKGKAGSKIKGSRRS